MKGIMTMLPFIFHRSRGSIGGSSSAIAILACCLFLASATTAFAQAGANQWTWEGGSNTIPISGSEPGMYGTLGEFASGNIPGTRWSSASWTDAGGNLWLFGGFGYDASDVCGFLNDMWKFNPSTNTWAWMGGSSTVPTPAANTCSSGQSGVYGTPGVPSTGNIPGARFNGSSWTDHNGHLWLFGGEFYNAQNVIYVLNDLWEFFPATNEWAWMGGSNTVANCTENTCSEGGIYGTLGTPATGNYPGARLGQASATDSNGNVWLFGGQGFDADNRGGPLNDLWEFNPSKNEWTWMGGSNAAGQSGTYGTLLMPASGNSPGGRFYSSIWVDGSNDLWIFGGFGYDADRNDGAQNDVWEWNPSTKEWAWMGGSKVLSCTTVVDFFNYCGQPGTYGSLGMPSAGNIPSGRDSYSAWTDSGGNFWLFDGLSTLNGSVGGYFEDNDLWKFDSSSNEWAWEGGSSGVDQPGVYGALGVPEPTDIPGSRDSAASWTDKSGNFWLFGGAGYDSAGKYGLLNDLWKYQLTPSSSVALTSPVSGSILPGSSATFTWVAGEGATSFTLWLGTTGVGSNNLWGSGATTSTTVTFGGLPTDGETIYARLYATVNGVLQYSDYAFTAASGAVLASPASGSTLPGLRATFMWTPVTGATSYTLWLGTTGIGSNDLWSSGGTTGTSVTFGGLPTSGGTIYARLFTYFSSGSAYTDSTYTASTKAAMNTPTPGSPFTGTSETFMWSPAVGATGYVLWLGTSGVGSNNVWSSGVTTGTSVTFSALPNNGATVYARIFTIYNGGEEYKDTTYTAH
jgi:N-acetylneuraminic acid mutarotase